MARGKRRLLILACTKSKYVTTDDVPAIDRYKGGAFSITRKYLAAEQDAKYLDVFVLSSVYGLVSADTLVPHYNQVMAHQQAFRLQAQIAPALEEILSSYSYSDICLSMSKFYLVVLEGCGLDLPNKVRLYHTDGGMGTKLAQVRHWLYHNEPYIKSKRDVSVASNSAG